MVQAPENWAAIVGSIVSADEPKTAGSTAVVQGAKDYIEVKIQVTEVESVSGYPNLFQWAPGKVLDIQVPSQGLEHAAWRPGNRVKLVVRKAGPQLNIADPQRITTIS